MSLRFSPFARSTLRLVPLLPVALSAFGAASPADPTRPPDSPSVEAAPGGGEIEAASARLQLIKLPREGRPTAVIDGQIVPLGGRIGDTRLVRLSAQGAVLRGPQGEERLFLIPEAEKPAMARGSGRSKEKE